MKNKRQRALLMFSGGFDSSCLLWDMIKSMKSYVEGTEKTLTIHPAYCNYGNKNTEKEIASAKAIIALAKEHLSNDGETSSVVVRDLYIINMSPTSGSITRNGGDCSHNGTWAKEYVPFRNATMIMSALSTMTNSSGLDIDYVYMGCHADDTSLKFPDCGADFEKAMNKLLSLYHREGVGEYPYVRLPFSGLTKKQISVSYAIPKKLSDLVFSGYTDGKPPTFQNVDHEDELKVETDDEIRTLEDGPRPVTTTEKPVQASDPEMEYMRNAVPMQEKEEDDRTIPVEVLKQMGAIAEESKEWLDPKNYPTAVTEQPSTSLMVKEHEPLIIRKFTQYGFPIYVGLICGANLDNLDSIVHGFLSDKKERIQGASIQTMRNIVGELSAKITETYGLKIEGVAVVWYVDKMMVSSLYGDFMTHTSCRIEFFTLLAMMCHV